MFYRFLSILAVIAGLLASGCAIAKPKNPTTFPIADVIEQVKRELAAAQSVPGASVGLNLEKVEATFSVTRSVDSNGKVSIGIPSVSLDGNLGGTRKTEDTSSVFVELAPPKPIGVLSVNDVKDFDLSEVIISTREQLLKGLNQEPTLEPKKVVITVKFTVQRSKIGGAQLKLVVLSVGGGVTSTAAETNTVALTFSRLKAP